jgi:hypothetical protein
VEPTELGGNSFLGLGRFIFWPLTELPRRRELGWPSTATEIVGNPVKRVLKNLQAPLVGKKSRPMSLPGSQLTHGLTAEPQNSLFSSTP